MKNENALIALILAAGEGTRMESDMAKVLHRVCGRPMISHVMDSVIELDVSRVIVVVGYRAGSVKSELQSKDVEFVLQQERLGTAHAVLMAKEKLQTFDGTLIVLTGDTPLLRSSTLLKFVEFHRAKKSDATVLTAVMDDAAGYGRIIRDELGKFIRIVEHGDANSLEREVREINSGIFCFDCRKLFSALEDVGKENVQEEYYLTDVMEIFRERKWFIEAYKAESSHEVIGVNNLEQLKSAERLMKGNG